MTPHSHLPSSDIHADWQHTVETFGVAATTSMIAGFSYSTETKEQIRQQLAGERVRMLMVDADGFVFAHLDGWLIFLHPNACW